MSVAVCDSEVQPLWSLRALWCVRLKELHRRPTGLCFSFTTFLAISFCDEVRPGFRIVAQVNAQTPGKRELGEMMRDTSPDPSPPQL